MLESSSFSWVADLVWEGVTGVMIAYSRLAFTGLAIFSISVGDEK